MAAILTQNEFTQLNKDNARLVDESRAESTGLREARALGEQIPAQVSCPHQREQLGKRRNANGREPRDHARVGAAVECVVSPRC